MLALFRRLAQGIRHSEGLQFLSPLWPVLRKPYIILMTALGQKRGITVKIGGCQMRLHPDFCRQNWEAIETTAYRAFAETVQLGAVVFDIGAHIGTYTMIALKRAGPHGRVVAYEPNDFTREFLLRHLRWNYDNARATVRDVCCGVADGSIDFYFLPGQAEGISGQLPVSGFDKRVVKLVSLDQEVSVLGIVPNIIKIDVEGAEWDVLKGAEQTLKQARPIIFLSLHPQALARRNESPAAILDWLQQLGYEHQIIAVDHEIHAIARCKDPQ